MIEQIDLRGVDSESLARSIEERWRQSPGLLLTLTHRPSKKWTRELDFARPLVLSSAALFEQILWVDRAWPLGLPAQAQQEGDDLLQGYHRLFSGAEEVETYLGRLTRHVENQEADLYPALLALAPLERAVRELGYEHQGLLKGATLLRDSVLLHRRGELSKAQKDRLDLDFFHLLEHHLEREQEALLPAWLALSDSHLFAAERLDILGNPLL